MAIYFLDTSALTKLYFQEVGTVSMQRLAAEPDVRLAVSTLGELEFRAAVRGRQRRENLEPAVIDALLDDFRQKASRALLRQALNDSIFEIAALLVDRYPLRSLDALQLGSCVALQQTLPGSAPVFTCSDQALLSAAAAERIPTWDPAQSESHPA